MLGASLPFSSHSKTPQSLQTIKENYASLVKDLYVRLFRTACSASKFSEGLEIIMARRRLSQKYMLVKYLEGNWMCKGMWLEQMSKDCFSGVFWITL